MLNAEPVSVYDGVYLQAPAEELNRGGKRQQRRSCRGGKDTALSDGEAENTISDAEAAIQARAMHRKARYESQFYKTKLCSFWQKGKCTRKEGCKYAHGEQELMYMPNLEKTAMCQEMLISGTCNNKDCTFAHSLLDLRATTKFYKTTMCCFYRYGACRLGKACRHAHSEEELRWNLHEHAKTNLLNRQRRQQLAMEPTVLEDDVHEDTDETDFEPSTPAVWQRIVTMPAAVSGQFEGMSRQVSESPSQAPTQKGMAADASIDEDLDSEDSFNHNEVPQWIRVTTSPAVTNGNAYCRGDAMHYLDNRFQKPIRDFRSNVDNASTGSASTRINAEDGANDTLDSGDDMQQPFFRQLSQVSNHSAQHSPSMQSNAQAVPILMPVTIAGMGPALLAQGAAQISPFFQVGQFQQDGWVQQGSQAQHISPSQQVSAREEPAQKAIPETIIGLRGLGIPTWIANNQVADESLRNVQAMVLQEALPGIYED